MSAKIILLATLDTKAEEAAFFEMALSECGLLTQVVDLSLGANGAVWSGEQKLSKMAQVADEAIAQLLALPRDQVQAVVGLGGGTGAEIGLRILRALPLDIPKMLVTTLPFDPRAALADTAITLVPTLADIAGLNASLRQVLRMSAAMLQGMVQSGREPLVPSIGVTALGVTQGASEAIVAQLRAAGYEATVFHANGYGGAGFSRFAANGVFNGVIDMTVHEITRLHIAGPHTDMPTRFSCANNLPRVLLPGGLNFITLGEYDTVPSTYLQRPHYRHSSYFTHARLTADEMERVVLSLAKELNEATAPVEVILPMGGFSSEDRPGGVIESAALRKQAAEVFEAQAKSYNVIRIPHHINAPETAGIAVSALLKNMPN